MSEIKTAEQRMMADVGFCESNEFYMQAEIDELRAALAERDAKLSALEEDRVYWMAQSDGWRTRAVKAECKLAAIELQEPAGTVDYAYDGAFRGLERKDGPTIKVGQNLYAAAGAAPDSTKTVDKAWSRFCGGIGRGPNAPYPGMIEAFEVHYGQSFTDKDWRNETGIWAAAWGYATRQAGAAPVPEVQAELIEALEELMRWQAKNVKCWHNSAYDNAARVLKQLAPKEPT